jgi:hypothetical protein
MELGDRPGVTALVTSLHFAPGPTCWGSVPLYVPPLSYKREGTRRYKADPDSDPTKAHLDSLTRSHTLSNSQVHTSSQAQYSTQWSMLLRSGGPNHSKPLRVLVFIPNSRSKQNA